jgi:coenzyme F420-reducing hydrogenase beta subunit
LKNNISCVKEKCFGCGLCKNKCPYNAIEFIENSEGFLYPQIIKEKCKNCGICYNVCPAINSIDNHNEFKEECYMTISKDKVIYKNSASGGFATCLSEYVITNLQGVVYGCNLDDNGNVKHIRVDNNKDLVKLQDSKYVQSNILDIFKKVKEDASNKKVLFIGTPCQVEAIEKYLNRKELDNLITCDLVCHGVPSPKLFKNYLNYLSKKYNRKVKDYRFRNKTTFDKCGFRGKLKIAQKDKYFFAEEDIYYRDFLEEKNYRLSCYNCKYKVNKRVGDFTIGDVNSWENYYDFYPELASSLVIVNNSKAKNLFDELEQKLFVKEISLEKEKKINKALSRQTELPEERKQIYQKYKNLKQYEDEITIDIDKKMQIKNIMKIVIPFKVRIFVKKILKRMNKNE